MYLFSGKKCPIEECTSIVDNIPRHLRTIHNSDEEFIKQASLNLRRRKISQSKEQRNPKQCPVCLNSYPRLDMHLQTTHKWSTDSDQYRSMIKKRHVKNLNVKSKTIYRQDVQNLALELRVWLETPNGGGRSPEEAKQTSLKVRQILQDLPEGFIETITEEKTFGSLENWFVKYSERNRASSSKAYVFAFKTLLTFALAKNRFNYTAIKEVEMSARLKRLLKFLSKRAQQQSSEKFNIPITHEEVVQFENSDWFLKKKESLESATKLEKKDRGLDYREFITINLLLHNGCRPCVVGNLTEEEFLKAEDVPSEDCYIAFVAHHKTIGQHGKARLAIPYFIHNIMNNYRSFVRPKELIDYKFAGRMVTPCLTTETGTRYTTGLILEDIQNCWEKAGLSSKILSMWIRKLAVTGVHEFGTEEDKDKAAMHQAHSKNTATAFYKQRHQAEQAAADSKIVRAGITGKLKLMNEQKQNQTVAKAPKILQDISNVANNHCDDFVPDQQDYEEDSEFEESPPPKKKKKTEFPSARVQFDFESKPVGKIGRGQQYFTPEQRNIIEEAFYTFIHGFNPSPNFVMKPPRMKAVRMVIEDKNLEQRLDGKCDPLKVLGCVKGLINKVHGYKT